MLLRNNLPCSVHGTAFTHTLPGNATIEEHKTVRRIEFIETATRCTAIQTLLAGAGRELACNALLVAHRALKGINRFNQSGIDRLIV